MNRGKRSLTLNLRSAKGREILLRLVEKSDVVVQNFQVGALERLGLDYAVLRERNPRIIYACISGFGQTGPYAGKTAFDVIVQGMGWMLSVLAGVQPVGGGDLGGGSQIFFCPEQLVIDHEAWQTLDILVKGFEVNDETLAVDVIRSVGPGGSFLRHRHTLKHMRNYWLPELFDRLSWEQWKNAGRKTLLDKAREKVKEILKTYQPENLDRDILKELEAIVKEADKGLLKN